MLDNPTCFLNPLQFEITFECIQELEDGVYQLLTVMLFPNDAMMMIDDFAPASTARDDAMRGWVVVVLLLARQNKELLTCQVDAVVCFFLCLFLFLVRLGMEGGVRWVGP